MNPSELTNHWLEAVARPEVLAGLEAVYSHAATEIAARGPACWASGRCCNFERTGHRLFVTGLETAYAVAHLPDIAGTRPDNISEPALSTHTLERARISGGCPFQLRNLCGIHPIKPLGCRLYFCDQGAQEWQQALSERLLRDIRDLHDLHSVEYRYGEWRDMLAPFARS